MSHRPQRGLTLLETMVAAALIAAIAATCTGLLAQTADEARHVVIDGTPPEALEALADDVMRDPRRFGIESWSTIGHTQVSMTWDQRTHVVGIERLSAIGDAEGAAAALGGGFGRAGKQMPPPHDWITFTLERQRTFRVIRRSPSPTPQHPRVAGNPARPGGSP